MADVYVINTCVVTGVGEKKSLQAHAPRPAPKTRRLMSWWRAAWRRRNGGLLAQGARLVLGNQRRGEVVELLAPGPGEGTRLSAVGTVTGIPYEPLTVSANDGHTRAVLKIQEGCDRYCAYCIIPYVRGTVRSRPVADIACEEAAAGRCRHREIVLTGIHLTSYGRDLDGVP
jgi:threonylcarbamoyladenosine tRNA methylthiotransferase MtaB